uniref:Uncharacterized protein LOC114339220 n=1 Tax=Diabrotica virgifera virgifera TaxID=50390 RepID=A0A6P7GKA0_DIAVI
MYIKTTNSYTRPFDISTGVLQGEPLRALLFSLLIADIEQFFISQGSQGISIDSQNQIIMLLYADDLVILCDSEVELGKNLSYLEKYSDKNQLTVNVGKTKILPFARSGQIGNRGVKFLYKNEEIEVVNKFVYLGVTLTTTSLFKAMADTTVERAKHAIGNVIGLMAKTKMNSWTSRVQLFDSLVQSLVMNCVPVWGMRYADQLERIQIPNFL